MIWFFGDSRLLPVASALLYHLLRMGSLLATERFVGGQLCALAGKAE
jgi:hypothetical protein